MFPRLRTMALLSLAGALLDAYAQPARPSGGATPQQSAIVPGQGMGGVARPKYGPKAISAGAAIQPGSAAELTGRIELDPICEPLESLRRPLPPGNPAPSTRKMAELLVQIRERANPQSMAYLSDRVVDLLEQRLTNATQANEKFRLQFMLALHQMYAARPDEALNTFSDMDRFLLSMGAQLDEETRVTLRMNKAMAFFRLGEQENCLATHNADSCVFPLQPKAYHLLPRGSRGAIALFSAHLAEYPQDLATRWLLNLAHMTLGEYPDKVSPDYLIPPERFQSDYNMPRFVDVSDGLGIDLNDLAGSVIIDDFDNDGLYDLVASAWDLTGNIRFFKNDGQGGFIERTSEAGLVGMVGSLNIQQTDFNNDGFLDIWAMRGAWLAKGGRIPSSLLRNNGDGTFTDVTEQAGLFRARPTQAARWFDFDGDGWLDLFIGNESTDPRDPDWCELFRNNRDGTFTECARDSGIQIAQFVKGVACADYNNDGRPDLFLAVRGGRQILLRNDGPVGPEGPLRPQWRFTDATASSGIAPVGQNFATFFFDYNNDGWEDLFISGYALPNGLADIAADYMGLPNKGETPKLYVNNRDGTFTDRTVEARLNRICHTMGHNYGDLDNDGWLDFYTGTGDPDFKMLIPNRMFRNEGGKFFQDVTTATGTGHIQKGHGVSFADLDDDGDQEVYIAMGGAFAGDFARNALFLNPVGSSNRWLKLKLIGTKANRPAIGARIRVVVQTPEGKREIFRTLSSGGSFGSNPLQQEIGLGNATKIEKVEIVWPGSSTRQFLEGLELNHAYRVVEGEGTPRALAVKPVTLRTKPTQHAGRPGTAGN